jgi:cell division protein FtsB
MRDAVRTDLVRELADTQRIMVLNAEIAVDTDFLNFLISVGNSAGAAREMQTIAALQAEVTSLTQDRTSLIQNIQSLDAEEALIGCPSG